MLKRPAHVIVSEADTSRAAFVRKFFPSVEVVSPEKLKRHIKCTCARGGADRVIEVAGTSETFATAWQCARPNGIVTIVAMYDKAQSLPLPDMYGKNLICKTGGVDGCHVQDIISLISERKLDTEIANGVVGKKIAEYETEFAELGGYEAEANADAMLNSLGVPAELADTLMADVDPKIKVKVLLAQALFGKPDILILDEPTNNLDARTANWLEDYLMDLDDTCIIIVSHNRHFLNRVCTHICDVDYRQITMYVGNYDFWYESSQLLLRQQKEANKKAEARAKELREFIARFSANAKRAKSATSRKKELEKLEITDIKPSSSSTKRWSICMTFAPLGMRRGRPCPTSSSVMKIPSSRPILLWSRFFASSSA